MPDYSSHTYWQSRFESETHFEWLGSGDIILPHVARAFGRTSEYDHDGNNLSSKLLDQPVNGCVPTKIIHIGSGTSQLSLSLRSLNSVRVINVDFEQSCLAQLRQSELTEYGSVKMEYEQLDMLDWGQVEARLGGEGLALVIDKSTSDAISCGPDKQSPLSISPIPPVQIIALHLAAICAPGSTWIALSYSSSRFEDVSEFWIVEMRERVAAESGQTKAGVCAPEVWHTLYALRRTNKPAPVVV